MQNNWNVWNHFLSWCSNMCACVHVIIIVVVAAAAAVVWAITSAATDAMNVVWVACMLNFRRVFWGRNLCLVRSFYVVLLLIWSSNHFLNKLIYLQIFFCIHSIYTVSTTHSCALMLAFRGSESRNHDLLGVHTLTHTYTTCKVVLQYSIYFKHFSYIRFDLIQSDYTQIARYVVFFFSLLLCVF